MNTQSHTSRNRRSFADYIDDRPGDRVFRVDRAIYNDPDILEAEYRNIFEANWVFLCHDAHVRSPGDYFATHIGRQPVFVVRKPDGALACYLNACGHRGATLVTKRIGNARAVRLPIPRLLLRHRGQVHRRFSAQDRLERTASRPVRVRSHSDRPDRQLSRTGLRQPLGRPCRACASISARRRR